MSGERTTIMTYENFFKFITLIGVLFSGFFFMESRLKVMMQDTINETIDSRIGLMVREINNNTANIVLLQIAAKKSENYIVSNEYRLNYHENFMASVTARLYVKFPHDFIKPEELKFEYFKEDKK